MSEPEKLYFSYNHIHKLCKQSAVDIKKFAPSLIISIGGGGNIPSRILRTFLKEKGQKNIPIQVIGLSLYENLGTTSEDDQIGKEVIRTQWLDFSALGEHFDSLIGKNILIVDEVDDTRTTLHYAVSELAKDVAKEAARLNRNDTTKFGIFVLHNKDKPKKAQFTSEISQENYFAALTVPDKWLCYPWDAEDIDEHTAKAVEQGYI
ncbi:Xanthine phosphoribosyltransferase [Wickerhamomyces ciferrii]|uniref:Xanthine phosphoribosyltransferase n=1 Tax=Wickerhamomyces ciferrii (strain ATCC 14091 / BCRC 22168 / CBS 111 / JCM 3599 / NBRC 0793 / NRRL Y-1031 F-60-10) TaxID=1206466 RepID=K0K697_WICCF|nr:Xanthine phosphoribosyltransferase [Wickerhamomyces ciferrii]CCH40470.1 Xanthine phosphoribosyltransferase [Wickerhamomyces ciferrii]